MKKNVYCFLLTAGIALAAAGCSNSGTAETAEERFGWGKNIHCYL